MQPRSCFQPLWNRPDKLSLNWLAEYWLTSHISAREIHLMSLWMYSNPVWPPRPRTLRWWVSLSGLRWREYVQYRRSLTCSHLTLSSCLSAVTKIKPFCHFFVVKCSIISATSTLGECYAVVCCADQGMNPIWMTTQGNIFSGNGIDFY